MINIKGLMALIFQYYECNGEKKKTLKRASVVNTPHYEMSKKKNENKVLYVCLHFDSTTEYKLHFQDDPATIAVVFFSPSV